MFRWFRKIWRHDIRETKKDIGRWYKRKPLIKEFEEQDIRLALEQTKLARLITNEEIRKIRADRKRKRISYIG